MASTDQDPPPKYTRSPSPVPSYTSSITSADRLDIQLEYTAPSALRSPTPSSISSVAAAEIIDNQHSQPTPMNTPVPRPQDTETATEQQRRQFRDEIWALLTRYNATTGTLPQYNLPSHSRERRTFRIVLRIVGIISSTIFVGFLIYIACRE
jgi:hypothetical protein